MRREIATQPHKAQTATYNINPRRNMPRQILIKLIKIKHKEQILKAPREKQQISYKGFPIRIIAYFSVETLQARSEWQDILRVMKRKTYSQDYYTQQGSHSDMKEKSKALQTCKS